MPDDCFSDGLKLAAAFERNGFALAVGTVEDSFAVFLMPFGFFVGGNIQLAGGGARMVQGQNVALAAFAVGDDDAVAALIVHQNIAAVVAFENGGIGILLLGFHAVVMVGFHAVVGVFVVVAAVVRVLGVVVARAGGKQQNQGCGSGKVNCFHEKVLSCRNVKSAVLGGSGRIVG